MSLLVTVRGSALIKRLNNSSSNVKFSGKRGEVRKLTPDQVINQKLTFILSQASSSDGFNQGTYKYWATFVWNIIKIFLQENESKRSH